VINFIFLTFLRPVIAITPAQTTTAMMTVTATVADFVAVTVSSMNFGTYIYSSPSACIAATITVTATANTPYYIQINAGQNAGQAAGCTNAMKNATSYLGYNLYTNNTCTTPWVLNTYNTTAYTGTGTAQTYTIYGQIPTNSATSPSGTYSDGVTVTIGYS